MRHNQWRGRLRDVLREARSRQFSFGEWDCYIFARRVVDAVTGDDPFPTAEYDSLESGLAAARALGFDDHVAIAESLFGPVVPEYALNGDLAVLDLPDGSRALGTFSGRSIWAVGPDGLTCAPRAIAVGGLTL